MVRLVPFQTSFNTIFIRNLVRRLFVKKKTAPSSQWRRHGASFASNGAPSANDGAPVTSGGAPLGGDGALSPVTAPLSSVTSGRRPRRSGCAPQRNALVLWEFLRTPLLLPKTAGNEFNKSLRNLYLSSFWSPRWSDHLPKFGWMKTSIFTAINMNLRNKSDIVTRNFVTCSLTWFTSVSCVNSDLQYTLSSDK